MARNPDPCRSSRRPRQGPCPGTQCAFGSRGPGWGTWCRFRCSDTAVWAVSSAAPAKPVHSTNSGQAPPTPASPPRGLDQALHSWKGSGFPALSAPPEGPALRVWHHRARALSARCRLPVRTGLSDCRKALLPYNRTLAGCRNAADRSSWSGSPDFRPQPDMTHSLRCQPY